MKIYHATTVENAAAILKDGFDGGWGDIGFGVYGYTKLHLAIEYLNRGGWDGELNPDEGAVIEIRVDEDEVFDVVPERDWPNPEDYDDVVFHPMDDGAGAKWKPGMAVAFQTTQTVSDWTLYGNVQIAGEERSVWVAPNPTGGNVYQITKDIPPKVLAGYPVLESLLKLKGKNLSDVELTVSSPKP